jgi:hypothetical protein
MIIVVGMFCVFCVGRVNCVDGRDGGGLFLKRNAAIVLIVANAVPSILRIHGHDALHGLFF